VYVLPILWIILAMSMAVAKREDKEKPLRWGILALYGVIAVPFLGLLSTISLKTQFVAITATEFLLLAVWISFLNRTTPNKPEKLTRFMGNLVLALLGISVVIVIAGAYVEGSPAMAGGLLLSS
jgi:heme A synthase